jgi:hypothetical protein
LIPLQNCFLQFDNITYKYNANYMNASFSVINTPDGKNGLFSYEFVLFHEFTRQQLRAEVKGAEKDGKQFEPLMKTTIDLCKLYRGVQVDYA